MRKTIATLALMAFGLGTFAQQAPPPAPAKPGTPATPGTQAVPAVPTAPPAPPMPPDPPRKEKVESMRIAFLTQKLDLTPEEAQKFWPVYNEFHKKRDDIQKKRREERKGMKDNIDSLSDKQIEAIVDGEMAFRQKNLDLEKEYHGKFKSVLSIKKVAKLYRAEEQFTHRLLDEISDRGKGREGKEGRGGRKNGMAPHNDPPPHEE